MTSCRQSSYIFAIFILFSFGEREIVATNFGYENDNGPDKWPGVCKTGKMQSPINIRADEIDIRPMEQLIFKNYDSVGVVELANNGHTVIGTGFEKWKSDKQPYITGSGLNGTYHLKQFHFHWSQFNNTGSEHTFASLHYPAELHLVHTKDSSGVKDDKFAVVAIFLTLGDDKSTFEEIAPYFPTLLSSGFKKLANELSVKYFIPEGNSFYRYEGSLTTPYCNEGVIWTLMAEPVIVTIYQLDALRQVRFHNGKKGKNYRPLMPLNGRRVQFRPSKFDIGTTGKTTAAHSNTFLNSLMLIFIYFFVL